MNLKYKILFIDHDDTSVDSTPSIHYPAHLEVMEKLRPNIKPVDLERWYEINFDPGIMSYLTEELGLDAKEMEEEFRIWRKHADAKVPEFFPGFKELLRDYQKAGGLICVISHSENKHISDFYQNSEIVPDGIYGWDNDPEKRKPSPWPIIDFLARKNLKPGDGLVLDDLKPGLEMARKAGCDFCAAAWAHDVPKIREHMQTHADYYAREIYNLRNIIFSG